MSSFNLGSFIAGQPVPPQPTGSDSTTQSPEWYQEYLANLFGSANQLAEQPYQPIPFNPVAGPSDASQQAWQMAINNVGNWQDAVGGAGALTYSAAQPLSQSTIGGYNNGYSSGVGNSMGTLSQPYMSTELGAGNAVTGALNKATQSQIGNYLSPYLDTVAGGIESQLNTNLMQNVLPNIQDRMVASGQVASPQQMQAENNAVYQNQQALGQALAPVYNQGYNTALGAAQGAAGAGYNTGASNANSLLGAGQYGYGLGTQTGLSEQQMQGTMGAQMGQLGALTSQLGASDIAEVAGSGSAQDALNQNNLNAQVANFENQVQWPYQQLGFLSNTIRGQQLPTNTQTTGLTYNNGSYAASPLQSATGAYLMGSALNGSSAGLKRGGHVTGALNRARAA